MLETLVMLEKEKGVGDEPVESDGPLRLSLGATEVEQPVYDPRASVDFLIDDLQVFPHRRSAVPAASGRRPWIAATQALIVARGLLISCMTPAAS